ncbi:uncharacterized protein PV09_04235 [Verruconis gallopava]|uniref:Dienelactone hydrolase domain-containing protein n=1 Tax=Verruconis gallopava TaxID=253628 RepID=A0A0D1XPJ2_9PEZI|nr:uncharacterized protein PV09_04235 [Verruconis gallopava]KIW04476.1 hypothetical protein PV09_04235 [Verruconis gallopava]
MASTEVKRIASDFCSHCLLGNIHEGESRGKIEIIEDTPTYVTYPQPGRSNGHVLFYFPDIHGFYNNSLLLMDAFADAGYSVFGIDYFRGDPIWKHQKDKDDKTTDPAFDRAAWRERHSSYAQKQCPKWMQAIASRYSKDSTKFAAVGYCFGAPYAMEAISLNGLASAGAFAHPTALTEEQFKAITRPLMLSCAENDHAFPADKRRRAEDILKDEGKKYHVQLFQGVNHGFAVRCNLDDPYEKYVKEQSYRGIVEWFNFWLTQ